MKTEKDIIKVIKQALPDANTKEIVYVLYDSEALKELGLVDIDENTLQELIVKLENTKAKVLY